MNGFTNWQTYLADLYGDQTGFHNSLREIIKDEETEIPAIMDMISAYWNDLNDETDTEIYLFNHFINYCLSEINYREIAQKIKETV